MAKSHEMRKALDDITKAAFGHSRSTALNTASCVTCGATALTFKNALSRKEYGISGMCQTCQDSVFNTGEGEDDDE